MTGKKQKDEKPEDEKNILEWAVFFVSLGMVIGLLAYLSYQSITYKPTDPDLFIVHTSDPSPYAPYRYKITLRNTGHQTATEVHLEFTLEKDGKKLEAATMEIPFAPQQSTREGWINFSLDPTNADSIKARVVSYKKQ